MARRDSLLFLYLAVFSVNLYILGVCNVFTWSSPSLSILHSNDTNINPLGRSITRFEESWIASLHILGTLPGTILAGYFSQKFGLKNNLVISAIPFCIAYLIIAHCQNVILFYISRFVAGMFAIFCISVVPSYVAEISLDHNRVFLGSIFGTSVSLAAFLNYSIGPVVSITTMAYITLSIMALFLITFVPFFPESPYYYLAKHRNKKAEQSLKKLRGNSNIDKEIQKMIESISTENSEVNPWKEIFITRSTRYGLFIGFSLLLFQSFMGFSILGLYLQTIIESSESVIPSYAVSTIVGVMQIIGCVSSNFLITKLGRNQLLYISAAGCSVTQLSLGIFFWLKESDCNISSIYWLPLLALSFNFSFYMMGWGPTPWVMCGEIYPTNVKPLCITLCSIFSMSLGFLIGVCFPSIVAMVGLSKVFCFFGIMAFLSTFFVKLFVPETNGKSLNEIQILLGKEKLNVKDDF